MKTLNLYATTVPSCCIPASYCHLLATLQTMSIIIKLQDNRAVFQIFIALLKFSFDCPLYLGVWEMQNDAWLRTVFVGIHGNGKFQVMQFFFVILM